MSVLCPVSCLLQFFFFFTARENKCNENATTFFFYNFPLLCLEEETKLQPGTRCSPRRLLLTCGFAVRFLAVGTVIYVDVWSVIFVHPNAADGATGDGDLGENCFMRELFEHVSFFNVH